MALTSTLAFTETLAFTFTELVLTLRFVREIANQSHAICRWLAGAAALFWLLRGWLQLFYSLSAQWPINQLHWVFTAVDGSLALVYGVAAWGAAERN